MITRSPISTRRGILLGLSTGSVFALSTLLLTSPLISSCGQLNAEAPSASSVDWYKPPPEEYRKVDAEISIPTELVGGVYPYRMEEAISLLGDAEIIEITKEQASHLSFVGDSVVVVRALLEKRTKKLTFLLEHPPHSREKYNKEAWEQILATNQRVIAGVEKDIKNYEEWQKGLKPYLIKAVCFGGATAPFFGGMVSDNLFISHIGLGSQLLPMQRMPVVAYLPEKPKHIYHVPTMMQ